MCSPLTSGHSGVKQAYDQRKTRASGHGSHSSPAGDQSVFGDINHGQIQHFQQTVIRWEDRFRFGHLAELPVETLNGVGVVNQPAHLLGVLEVGGEIRLIILPGKRNLGILL